MLLKPDCIPCILRMSVSAMHTMSIDDAAIDRLLTDILTIPALRGHHWHVTSPEVIEEVWKKIIVKIGDPDPLQKEKDSNNALLLDLYTDLDKMVNQAQDAMLTAVQLAIIGNSIDVMLADGTKAVKQMIDRGLETPVDSDAFAAFIEKLEKSRNVLFFGDNAGEIVLDRLLIETMTRRFGVDTHYVVRGMPTLNDATAREAKAVGLDRITCLVENGIDGPLPGTVLKRCSQEVLDLVEQSDLIISKGGGNFDALDEERRHLKKNITFMLLSKCYPYNSLFNKQLYQPILANYFWPDKQKKK